MLMYPHAYRSSRIVSTQIKTREKAVPFCPLLQVLYLMFRMVFRVVRSMLAAPFVPTQPKFPL